jgi:hypothetical protein
MVNWCGRYRVPAVASAERLLAAGAGVGLVKAC